MGKREPVPEASEIVVTELLIDDARVENALFVNLIAIYAASSCLGCSTKVDLPVIEYLDAN